MDAHRSKLRKELRKRRQALTDLQQNAAGFGLCSTLKKRQEVDDSQHIALYLANDGEINPERILQHLWKINKRCYLPVLSRKNNNEMSFAQYHPDTQLVTNRFGILEPLLDHSDVIAPEQLDLAFLPLTGFDLFGSRLGMGGGFYDRTFSASRGRRKPILIGLAHECQKVEKIPAEDWDVPLAGVATDRNFYSFG